MKSFVTLATLAALAAILSAGSQPASAQTAAQINATAKATRVGWCQLQVAMCSNVCAAKTQTNVCDVGSLAFACVCGNGTRIDFTNSVDLTIPYFTCITYQWQPCVNACPAGDQKCADTCNAQFVCGKVKADPNATVAITAASKTSGSGSGSNGGQQATNPAIIDSSNVEASNKGALTNAAAANANQGGAAAALAGAMAAGLVAAGAVMGL
ncbi:hypothetical protein H9P43_003290 [Blastocladiella emersonii ATCC 22665]|nr:hypothetical protein H9P43_003290 [Blastocladiella emersonii ATCC 22665]